MAKKRKSDPTKSHQFRNKLLLDQWLISLFGIDPLKDYQLNGVAARPFHVLVEPIRKLSTEGLDQDNLHHFFHELVDGDLFWNQFRVLSREQILVYEENIVRHTQGINEKRSLPVVWKYYQWLTLLFTEIYLDRYFQSQERLLNDLNDFVSRFNKRWDQYTPVPPYGQDDLNKICLQNATGSGKTLLMHVNLLQYRHYAKLHGKEKDLSRIILLTPNASLSEQHLSEFRWSGIPAGKYLEMQGHLFDAAQGQFRVDVLEITSLADQGGPNTVAARSLGDQNLLLVDEGHRGMSGKEEGVWYRRRSDLCAKGFTFEYSATFEQAVHASANAEFENAYAKAVLFDYSYRWFFEDGFGKDYQILNLPKSFKETEIKYLTACLLKYYQQLRIYEERRQDFVPFNIEKPLWVFVGHTVSAIKNANEDEKIAVADVVQIIQFIADFLEHRDAACQRINDIITRPGQDTGLLDEEGNDIFAEAFKYLAASARFGATAADLYNDILTKLFHCSGGGTLTLDRIKGDSGEVAMRVGTSERPFGLINVGKAKELCDHIADVASANGIKITVEDSDFLEVMFASVKESYSPINLLIGSKKFVEGWDCWRVSTLGLMHVGRQEGSQIIQLFGRGVRLKGWNWSLKRSSHLSGQLRPTNIQDLETLNVFGIEADFMQKFRKFLKDEGLPGNEKREVITIPLNVTYDFGKKLKTIRPKRKRSDGKEYDFKKDGRVPSISIQPPQYLKSNPVESDWYPRIQSVQSRGTSTASSKERSYFGEEQLALLNYDALYFDLEQFKRERSWHNLNIEIGSIRGLLKQGDWYALRLPNSQLHPTSYAGVLLLQQVATELLKRYIERYYNYCKRSYIEPRLELRELTREDELLPVDDVYQIIVDSDELQVIQSIRQVKVAIESNKADMLRPGGTLQVCNFGKHLYQPLLHSEHGKISILPISLNKSEFDFVNDLKKWCDDHEENLERDGTEIFLLRNVSSAKGVGFFEAANFHPDFILWMLQTGLQRVAFIEPHGLMHEGQSSEKILFYDRIKQVEKRLNDPGVVLSSFILSCTPLPHLMWGLSRDQLEERNVLFMREDHDHYVEKLIHKLTGEVKS